MKNNIILKGRQSSELDVFQRLVDMTPRDIHGFPEYLLDHQYIPDNIFDREGTSSFATIIDAAKIPLAIREGILTYANGTDRSSPIWEKMPNEPDEHHDVFKAYINMPLRNVGLLAEKLYGRYRNKTFLLEVSILYYWEDRARIYDLLRPVAASRLRDTRILLTENFHYQIAAHMLEQLQHELTTRAENNGRLFKDLSAKHLIECIETLSKIQRTALNLPATGSREPLIPNEQAQADAVKSLASAEHTTKPTGHSLEDKLNDLAANDPEAFEQLQEIVVSLHSK